MSDDKKEQDYLINKQDVEAIAWAVRILRSVHEDDSISVPDELTDHLAGIVNRCVGFTVL